MRREYVGLGLFVAGLVTGSTWASWEHKGDLRRAIQYMREANRDLEICTAQNRALNETIQQAFLVLGGINPTLVVMRPNAKPEPPAVQQ